VCWRTTVFSPSSLLRYRSSERDDCRVMVKQGRYVASVVAPPRGSILQMTANLLLFAVIFVDLRWSMANSRQSSLFALALMLMR